MTRVLKATWLFDAQRDDVVSDGWIVAEGKAIKEAGDGPLRHLPRGVELVELPGCTLLPALIDVHVHLGAPNVCSFGNFRVGQFESTPALQLLYAAKHARLMLEAGFTTVRDLDWATSTGGHIAHSMVALRDAIAAGAATGPRIVVGGWTHITASHLDMVLPRAARREPAYVGNGPWELRRLARENIRAGVDVIKTCASGGIGTDNEEIEIRNMTQEELDAIVDEAHAFKKKAAVHCHTPESIKRAVKAGADTIEHCVYMDDEAIAGLVASGRILVPTLAHRTARAIEIRRKVGTPEFILEKMERTRSACEDSFRKAYKAGVRMAMGTDTQIDPYVGDNAEELEIYVRLGMKPSEAIRTATANAAEAAGVDRLVGTIAPGKLCDVIAVEGNPLEDVTLLAQKEKVLVVLKENAIAVDRRR